MVKGMRMFNKDGVFTIVPEGKLDGDVAKHLEGCLLSEEVRGSEAVVIDLKDISVVTADGIRVFLNAHIDSQTSGRKLQLTNPNSAVSELLQTVGLTELIA
ncbi:MAG: Unknown protein [uncultured Thiotrichaceae bacterium]|uniref:STAS domain-containing protein n=1 Tax=uncultured Thiotrichaceae bacterium TaxID=298394 RepID=A0A6S6TH15_9GAMM|nr:MAG: Unknown protein [uncultured Thiotrichaceae bacterium]